MTQQTLLNESADDALRAVEAFRIVVVDRDERRAGEIVFQLDGMGYEAVALNSVDALVAEVVARRADLILLASRFEGFDGTPVFLAIREMLHDWKIPVILMCESQEASLFHQGCEAGMDEFLRLPLTGRQLSTRVRRALGLTALRRRDEGVVDDPLAFVVPTSLAGSKAHILLVEDQDDQRNLLRKRLEAFGHRISLASNGREGLNQIKEDSPDLVLTDLLMPEMDGFELCRSIKADPATQDIPVIIITSVHDEEGQRQGYSVGADDFMSKPVNASELSVRINSISKIRALRKKREDAPHSEVVEKPFREMAPLEAWFKWSEICADQPRVRELKRKMSEQVREFLDQHYDFRQEAFLNPETAPHEVKAAHAEIRSTTEKKIREILRQSQADPKSVLPPFGQEMLIRGELYERFALGPIQPLLDDPSISDLLVSRFNDIHIERGGRLIKTPVVFDSENHLRRIIDVVLRFTGKEINELNPFVESRLRDGSRVSVTIPPLSIDGATLTVRKFVVKRMELDDLLRSGTLSVEMAAILDLLVKAGLNVIVSGSTGAGKTTLLNLLGSCIPVEERIITVEDTAELRLRHREVIPELMGREFREKAIPAENMERFEARASHLEGVAISMRDIIRLALRKRPDRIIVGEVRGGEALDMLNAMNTGHRGCLTTIHANNTRDLMIRLENMVIEANTALPQNAVQRMVVAALNIAVQVVKFADNTRRITEITEIEGYDARLGDIVLRPLFIYEPSRLDRFATRSEPSERVHSLIEEYLMRTGRFRAGWDAPLSDEAARHVLAQLFRRHLAVFFPSFSMKGKDWKEKETRRANIIDLLVREVFDNASVLRLKWNRKSVVLHLYDVMTNELLIEIERESRRQLSGRLSLDEATLGALLAEGSISADGWQAIFPPPPAESRPGRRPLPLEGEGFTPEDIQAAFYRVVGAKVKEYESSDLGLQPDTAPPAPRIEALGKFLPYLKLTVED